MVDSWAAVRPDEKTGSALDHVADRPKVRRGERLGAHAVSLADEASDVDLIAHHDQAAETSG
jgi:hypothetical protein